MRPVTQHCKVCLKHALRIQRGQRLRGCGHGNDRTGASQRLFVEGDEGTAVAARSGNVDRVHAAQSQIGGDLGGFLGKRRVDWNEGEVG